MNSLQKVQVAKMRASGIGFKEISEKINIPVSTIKSYCYRVLNNTNLSILVFQDHLDYPCSFFHDADGAAIFELWFTRDLKNAVYLFINENLGGSVIIDRRIVSGKHGHNATFEHIVADPKGRLCYCRKRGCWETLCSLNALLGGEPLDLFFSDILVNDSAKVQRWHEYLKNLARYITSIHLACDMDFIIGGQLASYLTQPDIEYLYSEIKQNCPFEEPNNFILTNAAESGLQVFLRGSYVWNYHKTLTTCRDINLARILLLSPRIIQHHY